MDLTDRIALAWKQPLSRKLQSLVFRRDRLLTLLLRSWRLRACGDGSIVQRPLFWTPENISLGEAVLIWPGCRIEALEIGQQQPHIVIGDGVTIQQNCHITAGSLLRIDAGTTILFGAMITDMDHRYDDFGTSVYQQPIDIRTTHLGRNCFIGAGAQIMAGTNLGEQCVVGANAVVRGYFPAGSVIVGNPARVVRQYDSTQKTWSKLT
jgi:acetyltransferase-like isoleucine patch superfamily enzyme